MEYSSVYMDFSEARMKYLLQSVHSRDRDHCIGMLCISKNFHCDLFKLTFDFADMQ